jgi:hypothetical protein
MNLTLTSDSPPQKLPSRFTDGIEARPPLSRRARGTVAGIAVIVAIGALFGGYGLLADPAGLGVKQAWLDGTPFPDYTVPGVTLLVVIGGGMLFTAAAAVRGAPVAGPAAFVMGLALLVWGSVETVTIGYQGRPQILLLAGFVVGPVVPFLWIGWRSVILRTDARAHADADRTIGT